LIPVFFFSIMVLIFSWSLFTLYKGPAGATFDSSNSPPPMM
jgi:hypothetical protein